MPVPAAYIGTLGPADAAEVVKRGFKITLVVVGVAFAFIIADAFLPGTACAHDPRFACSPRPASSPVVIPDVTKSWAFYGALKAPQQDAYVFEVRAPITVPANLLVDERDAANPARPSLEIDDANGHVITRLGLTAGKQFYEPFSRVTYLSSSDLKLRLATGRYRVSVSMSGRQRQRYVFAIGRDERFGLLEIPYVLRTAYTIHNRQF